MLIPRKVMYRLLRRALDPELAVVPSVEADAIDTLPLLTFQTTIGAAVGGIEPPIAWEATTLLNVFAEDEDTAESICASVYDLFHRFNEPFAVPLPGQLAGYATVNEVEDGDGFDLIASAAIGGRNVVQYSGSFRHQIHAE